MKPFLRRHPRMVRTLAIIFAVVVVFDAAMAVAAWRECRSDWGEDEAWSKTRRFDPTGPTRDRAVILVHGFMGSPLDFRPIVADLREAGFTVVIPLVPGQTKSACAYRRGSLTADFYVRWIEEIVREETEKFGRKPHLVGFSMGGTIATVSAAAGGVEKLVLLAPFHSLPTEDRLLVGLARTFSLIIPLVPKPWRGRINDSEGLERYRPGSRVVSLSAFLRLKDLAALARDRAASISAPTLVLASPNDAVASFDATRELFGANPGATIREYPRSNHVLLYDHDREEIVREVVSFLAE